MAVTLVGPTTLEEIDDLPKDELRHILRHFAAPPPAAQINQQDPALANIPPLKHIPHNLFPNVYDPHVVPPRLYLGFRRDGAQANKRAVALGCTESKAGSPPDSITSSNYLMDLVQREVGCAVRFQLVLSGKSEVYVESIYSLGSNYTIRKMLKSGQLKKAAEILGFAVEDVRWWVDADRWYWDDTRNRFDIPKCREYVESREYLESKSEVKAEEVAEEAV